MKQLVAQESFSPSIVSQVATGAAQINAIYGQLTSRMQQLANLSRIALTTGMGAMIKLQTEFALQMVQQQATALRAMMGIGQGVAPPIDFLPTTDLTGDIPHGAAVTTNEVGPTDRSGDRLPGVADADWRGPDILASYAGGAGMTEEERKRRAWLGASYRPQQNQEYVPPTPQFLIDALTGGSPQRTGVNVIPSVPATTIGASDAARTSESIGPINIYVTTPTDAHAEEIARSVVTEFDRARRRA